MQHPQKEPIAIIGIGCRFPCADNPQAFWDLLRSGGDAIREVPPERWNVDALYDATPARPGKMISRRGGFLQQIDQFDWHTWRLLPKEVRQMDPQQRLLLEVAWETLEDAGIPLEQISGTRAGVFIGIGWSDYLRLLARNWLQIDGYTATGNASGFAANRLSYLFDLKGPSVSLDTGCTSSLTAVHQACQSLWAGETCLALAGGVNLLLSPDSTIMVSQAGLLSADGYCKTLDAHADGFVRGEGAGMVLLKPLSQVASTDRVYALIHATAVNHNGHNEWMIAPSEEAQEALLREIYSSARIAPSAIGYVELHGTGFLRGDAIEASALGRVLGADPHRQASCMIGSVKTNIGHLEEASGIASVIKVALALYHREIPPTLHMQTINPGVHMQEFHLAVPQQCCAWPGGEEELFAGVTALALNGSNAHAILSDNSSSVRKRRSAGETQRLHLLPLSARSEAALRDQIAVMRDFLVQTTFSWNDICYTASVRRTHHVYRLAVCAQSAEDAAQQLDAFLRDASFTLIDNGDVRPFEKEALVAALKSEKRCDPSFCAQIAALYMRGEAIPWSELYIDDHTYACVSLPTYRWQRERLWPDWLNVREISTPPELSLAAAPIDISVDEAGALPVEQALTMLWADVLGLEQVNAQDSFFTLGGHSLLAMQLLARIQTTLHVDISLVQLLQNPTPAMCSSCIAELKAASEGVSHAASALLKIVPDAQTRYQPFPTTDVQQVYWVGRSAAFELGNVGNHAYIEVEAAGLDMRRFDTALQRLIQRHEMLRAVLLPSGEQQILPEVPVFQSRVVDLRALHWSRANMQLERARQGMDHQILPIDRCPTFEILVFYVDEKRIHIHLSVESLFFDAWSMNILLQEFRQLYYEPEKELPALDLSFRDYILAERTLRETEAYERARVYWRERLTSLPTAPELPLVTNTGALTRPRFEHIASRLDKESWQRLKARGARCGLTPSGILLAAFAEVLATWSKTPRFGMNLSLFNRHPFHAQVNAIVGDFTSLLVLAVDVDRQVSFEERACRLQAQLWRDLDHSLYSGVQVLRELARQHGGVLNAVMPVVFTSLLIQDTASSYPSPWQETIYCVTQTPQVWLDHQVLEAAGELVFHWQFVAALFPPGLIQEMFTAYCSLLQKLSHEMESWHEKYIPLVPPAQLAQRALLNATQAPVSEELLHTLFIKQVYQRPLHMAVVAADKTLTYQQLYKQVMYLGHLLRQAGACPGMLVAVVLEKGWEQVVAVLSILFSGAAYLPIDPALPNQRLSYLLEHGKVEIILTQASVRDRVVWPSHMQLFCVDTLDFWPGDPPPLPSLQKPDDLAYVIYTSGSTGLPKGVMIDHRGAVNTILDVNQRFHVDETDRVLALSALNFDLSVYDIFGTLAAGGTIVIPEEGTTRNPAVWLELLLRQRVTIWNSVPALFQMFVEFSEADAELLRDICLRLALLSGDWIPVSLPDRARALLPAIDIISMGGATEASIWSILYPITTVDPAWRSIPYGRPMLNQRFAVFNDALEPCPVWVPGTLYISGIGLAQGYWRDDEKTVKSFLLHPRTGERFYHTGDLGRYLPDGTIEFLGREDFQVKVQGYRIELGEIEETLLQHPSVRAAVTVALSEPGGEKRLVSYVVLHAEEEHELAATPHQPSQGKASSGYTLEQLRGQASSQSHPAPFLASSDRDAALHRLELQYGQQNRRQDRGKPTLDLTRPALDESALAGYRNRVSYRTFLPSPLTLAQLERFLSVLSQVEIEGLPKYRYPSAGGIYPVQTYLSVRPDRITGLAEGVYYYQPQSHQLVRLADAAADARHIHAEINQSIYEESAFTLFFIAQQKEMKEQYGDAAQNFCVLEAGYMSQLLMMEAPEYQIGLCPVGGLDFSAIRHAFLLEESHLFVHALLGGHVDSTMTTGWSFLPTSSRTSVSPAPPLPLDLITRQKKGIAALRTFLQERLPEYMLPSAIIPLDALPLTANGKVDRKNLPVPVMVESEAGGTFVAPQTDLQRQIAAIWQEVLPDVRVGLHNNFFDLGGNSLLMVRAYTRLRKMMPQNISIIEMFFRYPTIHALTEFLTKKPEGVPIEEQIASSTRQKAGTQQGKIRRQHRLAERKNPYA